MSQLRLVNISQVLTKVRWGAANDHPCSASNRRSKPAGFIKMLDRDHTAWGRGNWWTLWQWWNSTTNCHSTSRNSVTWSNSKVHHKSYKLVSVLSLFFSRCILISYLRAQLKQYGFHVYCVRGNRNSSFPAGTGGRGGTQIDPQPTLTVKTCRMAIAPHLWANLCFDLEATPERMKPANTHRRSGEKSCLCNSPWRPWGRPCL
jgi:hypothetical protein